MRCFKLNVTHKRRTYTFVSLDRVAWVWFVTPERGFFYDIESAARQWGYVRADAFEHWRRVMDCRIGKIIETTIQETAPYDAAKEG